MRNFSDRSFRENPNICYFLYSFLVQNREIMWINKLVGQATDDSTVRYMRMRMLD